MKSYLKVLHNYFSSIFTFFLIVVSLSCSSDTETETPTPIPEQTDPTEETEQEEDADNDGVPDDEDVDDDNDGLIEIFSINGLNDIRTNLTASKKPMLGLANKTEIGFELMADLDFENPTDYQDQNLLETYTTNEGWQPIGTSNYIFGEEEDMSTRFGGVFEGNGFTIKNLYINRPEESQIGFFGACNDDAVIRNLNLELKSVMGNIIVGGLVGLGRGSIENVTVNGNIRSTSTGQAMMGLLVGRFEGGIISNCATFGSAESQDGIMVGGLLGRLVIPEPNLNATITNCFSEANITAESRAGGLIGSFSREDAVNAILTVEHCYALGNVIAESDVGGLIGSSLGSVIISSYAKGNIMATREGFGGNGGGLIGFTLSASINSCYATGNVRATSPIDCMGGLVGYIHSTTVTTSYSTGLVEGNLSQIGGLTGRCPAGSEPTINNTNYWDTETSGLLFSRGEAQGLITKDLQSPTANTGIYATWDSSVWDFGTSSQYPVLRDMPNGIENQR